MKPSKSPSIFRARETAITFSSAAISLKNRTKSILKSQRKPSMKDALIGSSCLVNIAKAKRCGFHYPSQRKLEHRPSTQLLKTQALGKIASRCEARNEHLNLAESKTHSKKSLSITVFT